MFGQSRCDGCLVSPTFRMICAVGERVISAFLPALFYFAAQRHRLLQQMLTRRMSDDHVSAKQQTKEMISRWKDQRRHTFAPRRGSGAESLSRCSEWRMIHMKGFKRMNRNDNKEGICLLHLYHVYKSMLKKNISMAPLLFRHYWCERMSFSMGALALGPVRSVCSLQGNALISLFSGGTARAS